MLILMSGPIRERRRPHGLAVDQDMGDAQGPGTSFTVTGGRGSIRYTLADIEAAGSILARVAEEMSLLVDRLRAEMLTVDLASTGLGSYPYAVMDALREVLWLSMNAQAGLVGLARDATAAAGNYETTEARNTAMAGQLAQNRALTDGLSTWAWGPLMPLKMAMDAWGSWQTARNTGLRDASEDALNLGPAYFAGVLGPGMALAYGVVGQGAGRGQNKGVLPALAVRKLFDVSGLARPGRLVVAAVPPSDWGVKGAAPQDGQLLNESGGRGVRAELEPTIAGLLAGSQDAYAYPPGSLAVLSIDRDDGTRAWVVHLPGTEDWSHVDSANPWDLEGNLEGMTAGQAAIFTQQQVLIQEFMKTALHDAGALPGEDVLITGHSGGGIHAAAAAANPVFLAEVNVKMIVIAGAPARNLPVADGIAVLDLQNEHDIVASADFGPQPATPNWVAVTSHRTASRSTQDPLSWLGDAHELGNYVEDAKALEDSQNPALAGSRASIAGFFGSAAASGAVPVRKFVYQAVDVNAPGPKRRLPPVKGTDFAPGSR